MEPEVNILPKLYREAIDRPTVLYILYSTVSAQQMNLLPENTYYNDSIIPRQKSISHYYIGPNRNA